MIFKVNPAYGCCSHKSFHHGSVFMENGILIDIILPTIIFLACAAFLYIFISDIICDIKHD